MDSERIARMSGLISRFRVSVDTRRHARTHSMASFLERYRRHLSSVTYEDRFNVLDLFGVGNDEVRHSSILAWLLTPYGSHGCGPLFLKAFLSVAGVDAPSLGDLIGCRVRTEFAGHDSIIDVLVYKPSSFVMYVENKVLAAEGPRQVDRELADMVRFGGVVRVPRDRMFPVFLTPTGRPPTSGDPAPWLCVSYVQLAREFERLAPGLNTKTKYFVEDLVDQYRRWSSA